jgi:hypothetical protein
MQAFECNKKIDEIVCRQFQSSCIQKEKGLKMQSITQGRGLEKWCTFNYFKG